MASSAYTKLRYMKLLVSKSTNTLVPMKIAAERIDRHGIRPVQTADKIGDGVFGVHETAVHEVARVEEYEHVGADEGVGILQSGQRIRPSQQRHHGAPRRHRQGLPRALRKSRDRLRDPVFRDADIGGLQSVDVMILAVDRDFC